MTKQNMSQQIKELRDFYLLDDKLLYVSEDFIGYDPLISKGLSYKKSSESGTTIKIDEFKMENFSFNAILTYHISRGPLRGYTRAEILKDGRTVIKYEHGGMGHGSNYSEGNYFHLEYGNAFLLKDGYAMRDTSTDKIYSDFSSDNDYFFWFKNIVIPDKLKSGTGKGLILESDRIYSYAEIEPLRDILWEANLNFNGHKIYIKKTGVVNCTCTYGDYDEVEREEFQSWNDERLTALDKIEFIWKN